MPPKFLTDPLASVPEEVVLARPPLKLVLAHVGFTPILAIESPGLPQLASFQEAVRKNYPNYETQNDPMGIIHVFKSADGGWEVALKKDTLILAATQYETKKELVDRFREIVGIAKEIFDIGPKVKVGLRYIDRIEDDTVLNELDKYINPAFLPPFHDIAWLEDLCMHLNLPSEEAGISLRWGIVPPHGNLSNVFIPPISEKSWALSLDMYDMNDVDYDFNKIIAKVDSYSGRIYAVFRHVVTDDFIRFCGGKI